MNQNNTGKPILPKFQKKDYYEQIFNESEEYHTTIFFQIPELIIPMNWFFLTNEKNTGQPLLLKSQMTDSHELVLSNESKRHQTIIFFWFLS